MKSYAFPVGTGIYRNLTLMLRGGFSVPCGYRDIPRFGNAILLSMMRSLWVQGYTVILGVYSTDELAFPVGTGIYRRSSSIALASSGVPCGYRDIPRANFAIYRIVWRSLWVQGYTAREFCYISHCMAFPVGTGIYRRASGVVRAKNSVPCGYRDIPLPSDTFVIFPARSLWVQGYTALESYNK